jgi:hypothetical protein
VYIFGSHVSSNTTQNNMGNHDAYLFIETPSGARQSYTGQQAILYGEYIGNSTAPCDKNEDFGNPSYAVPISAALPLWDNVPSYCVWMSTYYGSEGVCGMTTLLPDQCIPGNTIGHQSFYIVFIQNF